MTENVQNPSTEESGQPAVERPPVIHVHKITLVHQIHADAVTDLFDRIFRTTAVAEERTIIVQNGEQANPIEAAGYKEFGDNLLNLTGCRLLAIRYEYLGTRAPAS